MELHNSLVQLPDGCLVRQLIWPEFISLHKSGGIFIEKAHNFIEKAHNTFEIPAAGEGGGAEQLLQVQSSRERGVKV